MFRGERNASERRRRRAGSWTSSTGCIPQLHYGLNKTFEEIERLVHQLIEIRCSGGLLRKLLFQAQSPRGAIFELLFDSEGPGGAILHIFFDTYGPCCFLLELL